MEDVVNRLSRELASAMAAAVADDQRVEACHERARAAGYDMKVSLEAVIGFANRAKEDALAPAPVAKTGGAEPAADADPSDERSPASKEVMSSNDRRFLRSLRIAADATSKQAD